jgi:hypothetical protein
MMKTKLGMMMLAAGMVMLAPSCKKEGCTDPAATNYNPDIKEKNDDGSCIYPEPTPTTKSIVDVSGSIYGNRTWDADTIYRLNSFVRVEDGAILTIEAGTVIFGDFETKGTLVVQQGGKLMAIGTAEDPIIFTSEKAVGLRSPGDWGGIVLCGKAPNNISTGLSELEGAYGGFHGGTDAADNSGTLKYIQICYAGIPLNPNQEVNSLTLGSVGSGTTIENIVCAYGLDDSFEWFGGTVNCKYLVAYRGFDDDFDVDNGYSGNVQYCFGVRGSQFADQSLSNGFEVDNDGSGSSNTPFTSPTFSNVTLLGPKADRNLTIDDNFGRAMHLRRNNKIHIHNSFFTAYPTGIYIDGSGTTANATADELQVRNCVLAGVDNWGGNGWGSAGTIYTGTGTGEAAGINHPSAPRGFPCDTTGNATGGFNDGTWFLTAAYSNEILDKWQDAGIDAGAFSLGTPAVLPIGGSALLTGASFTGMSSWFETVTFRGAFGTTNWASWADWNCATTVYN